MHLYITSSARHTNETKNRHQSPYTQLNKNLQKNLSKFVKQVESSDKVSVSLPVFFLSFAAEALERDHFMSPEEAKDFGLIDKVLAHPPLGESSLNPGDQTTQDSTSGETAS